MGTMREKNHLSPLLMGLKAWLYRRGIHSEQVCDTENDSWGLSVRDEPLDKKQEQLLAARAKDLKVRVEVTDNGLIFYDPIIAKTV